MICNRGHEHGWSSGYRSCAKDECTTCDSDENPCNVVSLIDAAAAPCQRAIQAHDSTHLTGFTTRAVSALVHLRDAWCNADESNKPGIERAMTAVFSTRSIGEDPLLYIPYLVHGLSDALGEQLVAAVVPLSKRKRGRR